MSFLYTAVALVGALAAVNLTLTYGVIRRLREHTGLLSSRRGPVSSDLLRPIGSTVDEFTAVADDGTVLSRDRLGPATLVAFFVPGCRPCAALLPRFIASAAGRVPGTTLAVVAEGDDVDGYREQLAAVATVIGGGQARPLTEAFDVNGFPAVCLVGPGGTVTASGEHLLETPQPVAA
jgi:hypothetical protein